MARRKRKVEPKPPVPEQITEEERRDPYRGTRIDEYGRKRRYRRVFALEEVTGHGTLEGQQARNDPAASLKRLNAAVMEEAHADAGHHLVMACRGLVSLAGEDRPYELMEALLDTPPDVLAMVAGQLAAECAAAEWTPQGDKTGASNV